MAQCPACRRPVAMARPRCVYCGAALSTEAVAEAISSAAALEAPKGPSPAHDRVLVVLDWRVGDPAVLAEQLEVPPFQASVRQRRGGYALLAVLDPAAAEEEAARLRAAGLALFLVPEATARGVPWMALSGRPEGDGLRLRGEGGDREVRRDDLLLVVRGPIVREYQARATRRKIDTAGLQDGHRFHLHLRSAKVPLELDPADFDFRESRRVTDSSLLELSGWIEGLEAPMDDAFRSLPPALGPAASPTSSASSVWSRISPGSRATDQPSVLDNLAQFRFYSGWRAAVERLSRA